jgi:pimeloyl-ACP methyl ester carboxylesterase
MSARRHFDKIFDTNYDDDEEGMSILQSRTKPRDHKDYISRKKRTVTLVLVIATLLALFLILSSLLVFSYFIMGSFAFDKIFLVGPKNMSPDFFKNTYLNYTTWGNCPGITVPYSVNFSKYIVPLAFIETNVSFPSRDPFWVSLEGGIIRASFYNYDNMTSRPTVIVVHGYKDCRLAPSCLAASGMLWHNGFNVLSIDLRNHGYSDCYKFQPPYTTFGSEEHKDVLGAYDYLVARYRNTTGKITSRPVVGLYGVSMGASTSLIAYAQEHNISSVFVDSPPCDVFATISNIVSNEYHLNAPFIMTSACATCKIQSRYGCPPFQYDPSTSCQNINNNRRVHIEWTRGDLVVPISNLQNVCLPALQKAGANVTVNIMDSGVPKTGYDGCDDHTFNLLLNTTAYEQRLVGFFSGTLLGQD